MNAIIIFAVVTLDIFRWIACFIVMGCWTLWNFFFFVIISLLFSAKLLHFLFVIIFVELIKTKWFTEEYIFFFIISAAVVTLWHRLCQHKLQSQFSDYTLRKHKPWLNLYMTIYSPLLFNFCFQRHNYSHTWHGPFLPNTLGTRNSLLLWLDSVVTVKGNCWYKLGFIFDTIPIARHFYLCQG